jgi:hypothetical protein
VSYRLLQCRPLSVKEMAEEDHSVEELPDVVEQPKGKLSRIRCACDYTLSGSDPRCDFDHSDEQASLVGSDQGADPCVRGKSLCDSVCQRQEPG